MLKRAAFLLVAGCLSGLSAFGSAHSLFYRHAFYDGVKWTQSGDFYIRPELSSTGTSLLTTGVCVRAEPPAGYKVQCWYGTTSPTFDNTATNSYARFAGATTDAFVDNSLSSHYIALGLTSIEYDLHYNLNGGKDGPESLTELTCADDFVIATEAGTKTGYTFANKWTNEQGEAIAAGTEITGTIHTNAAEVIWSNAIEIFDLGNEDTEVTLTAVWNANTYTVTFDVNGGESVSPTSKTVTYDQPFGALPTPTWTGHKFTGWYTAATGGSQITSNATVKILTDTPYYAQWSENISHTVDFYDANMFGGDLLKSDSVAWGEDAVPPDDPEHPGYTFMGWSQDYTGIKANKKIYATYQANTYQVRFYANDGTGAMQTQAHTYDTEKALAGNTFTRTGYSFLGWSTNATDTVAIWQDKATVLNLSTGTPVSLYAVWQPNPYAVSFHACGGEGVMADQAFVYNAAQALASNAFTKVGAHFIGWATSEVRAERGTIDYADGQVVSNLTTVANATLPFYAVWTNNAYTVKYEGNGGKGQMADQAFVYGTAQHLTSNAFVRGAIWQFQGWTNAVTGASYADGALVSNLTAEAEGVVTLTANWQSQSKLSEAMHCETLVWTNTANASPSRVIEWTPIDGAGVGHGTDSCVRQISQGNGLRDVQWLTHDLALTNSGTLTFWYKVSSEDGVCKFLLGDGDELMGKANLNLSGTANEWHQFTTNLVIGLESQESLTKAHVSLVYSSYEADSYCDVDGMTWTPEGTHPEPKPEDAPTISGVEVKDGTFTLSFEGDEAFDYVLQATDSLSPTNWIPLMTNAGAQAMTFEPLIDASHPQRFFQIEVIQKK